MIATREPGPQVDPGGGSIEPMMHSLRFETGASVRRRAPSGAPDACAVTMTFNGTQYRAVLDLDKGIVDPIAVARMLETLAAAIREEAK